MDYKVEDVRPRGTKSRTNYQKFKKCTPSLIRVVQRSLTQDALRSLVQAFIHCRLDYCNALLAGIADTRGWNGFNQHTMLRLS